MRKLVLLLVASLVSFCSPQNNQPPQLEQRPPAALAAPVGNNRLVTLAVQVNDRAGAPVRGLQQQDFTLLDGKQTQDIVSFKEIANDPPVEVILVVDAVNSSVRGVTYERDAIKKFLLRNNGKLKYPTSLIVFAYSGTKVQNAPSRDGNALAAVYDQYETGLRQNVRAQGVYGGEERYANSLRTLAAFADYERDRPGRKLMIWFSSGWPLLSNPRLQISTKAEDKVFDSIVSLSGKLRQADITLYNVDPRGVENAGTIGADYYEEFTKGIATPSHALPGNLGLQVLAVQTGGHVFNTSNDLAAEIENCAADADGYYVVSFNAPPADQPNEYHSLAIKIDKPDITARTRTGYYAQP